MKISLLRSMRALMLASFMVLVAALVAAGCGTSSKAANAKGLEFVPSDALMYAVFNTDFSGGTWGRFDTLAGQFTGWADAKKDIVKQVNTSDSGSDITYDKDIKPWLGAEAGVAVTSIDASGKSGEFFGWVASKDDGKAMKTLKDSDTKSRGTYQGYDIFVQKDDSPWWTLKDGVLLLSNSETGLRVAIDTKKGKKKSITTDGDVKDVAGKVDSDALVSMVISGNGLRSLMDKATSDPTMAASLGSVKNLAALKAFKGLSVGFMAADNGFKVKGYAGFDKDKLGDTKLGSNFDPTLMKKLPGDALFAVSANDLGQSIKSAITSAKDANPQMATQISTMESQLGISIDDIAAALNGQFALTAVSGAPIPSFGAIFEATDEAKVKTLVDKVMGIAGTVLGAAPKDATVEGIAVKQITVKGLLVSGAVFDGKAVVGTGPEIFKGVKSPTSTLGDDTTFKDAWSHAGAPDKVAGVIYVNTPKIIELAGAMGAGAQAEMAKPLGPIVGWIDSGSDSTEFDLFVDVAKK